MDQVLRLFDIEPNYDLNLMQSGQTIFDLTARALLGLEAVIEDAKPELVLVQGDTTTAFVGALAAFYSKTTIGHVEAGLRSRHKYEPFPEEMNRRLVTELADLHFAPTELARGNLLKEGVDAGRIHVTGNTGIDALFHVLDTDSAPSHSSLCRLRPNSPLVIVTTHRRENWGEPIERVCEAIYQLTQKIPDLDVIYSMHPNPLVRATAERILSGIPSIQLLDAVEYGAWVQILKRATVILTDSGGIQEEAPSLGKPVLVLRNVTERSEGIEVGSLKLVGTDVDRIVLETLKLLTDKSEYAKMAQARNPYGDGKAAGRIVRAIVNWFEPQKGRPHGQA